MLNAEVKFVPSSSKRKVIQCSQCQRYGNTKNVYLRQPRCVKWTQYHLTSNCPRKEKSENVKRERNHPANRKGYTVYKQLQTSRYSTLRKKEYAKERAL